MMTRDLDHNATTSTRATYARIAPLYDFLETLPEQRYKTWRRRFWQEIKRKMSPGGRLLEVGVGTGKNMPYWPQDADITAVDLTPAMLRKAEVRAQDLQLEIDFRVGDAQKLEFPDNTFDLAAATFVFCSVPDPILGLRELIRVVKPEGWVFLMEHVRAENVILGSVMDLVNPIVVRMMGPNINRDTVGNVRNSGLDLSRVDDLGLGGIFKMIVARIGEVKMEMVD
jgi:ubiquinone/menaquinone biosynthesis C-methylase UbiE